MMHVDVCLHACAHVYMGIKAGFQVNVRQQPYVSVHALHRGWDRVTLFLTCGLSDPQACRYSPVFIAHLAVKALKLQVHIPYFTCILDIWTCVLMPDPLSLLPKIKVNVWWTLIILYCSHWTVLWSQQQYSNVLILSHTLTFWKLRHWQVWSDK